MRLAGSFSHGDHVEFKWS